MPVVALSCSVPDEKVVLEAVRVALKPAAPAGEAKLRSTASETPPAASFLQKRAEASARVSARYRGRMASIGRPGSIGRR